MDDHTAMTLGAPDWRRSDGLVPYDLALSAMRDRAGLIRDGLASERVWLLQHPPSFTAGTSARAEDLFNPQGFPTYEAGRGGQWTYHGPGQRIAYVMLDLHQAHGPLPARDVHAYVTALEGWLIDALDQLGVQAFSRPGRVGVWVADPAGGESKIAAIGVRMTRWVSWHGISVNLDPALDHFDGIVPCGIREHGVTSLRALGISADMHRLDRALAEAWPARFGGGHPDILPEPMPATA